MKHPRLLSMQYIMEEHNYMNKIKTIELFAGVGGFRLGLDKAKAKDKSFEVVWSNQWEPSTKLQHASDIYCARFGFEWLALCVTAPIRSTLWWIECVSSL